MEQKEPKVELTGFEKKCPEDVLNARQSFQENYEEMFPDKMPTDEDTLIKAEAVYDILLQEFHKCKCNTEACAECGEAAYGCKLIGDMVRKEYAIWCEAIYLAKLGITSKEEVIKTIKFCADLGRHLMSTQKTATAIESAHGHRPSLF